MNEGTRTNEWNRLQEELQHMVDARLADRPPKEAGSSRTGAPGGTDTPRPSDARKTAEPPLAQTPPALRASGEPPARPKLLTPSAPPASGTPLRSPEARNGGGWGSGGKRSLETEDASFDHFGRSGERRPYVGKRIASLRTKVHHQLVDRVKELEEEVLRLGIRAEVAESSLENAERHYEERLHDLRVQLWAAQGELDEERERSRTAPRKLLPRLFGR